MAAGEEEPSGEQAAAPAAAPAAGRANGGGAAPGAAPMDKASALSASLIQAQAAIQAMMASTGGSPGWWGGVPANTALDAMKEPQPPGIGNPAQFNQALDMLEQAVAMARAAKASEDLHAANLPGGASSSAGLSGAGGRASSMKKEREVPGEREGIAAGTQCARCFDLISKPVATFYDKAVCGMCAEALAAIPRAAGGIKDGDGAGGPHEKQMRNVLTEEGALRIFRCKEQHRARDDYVCVCVYVYVYVYVYVHTHTHTCRCKEQHRTRDDLSERLAQVL
jgi:hypothetical protein